MFSRRNAVLVGVPTGERSDFDALDLDYRHGAATWEQSNAHRLPETRTHQTPSGGRHLLFRHVSGICNSAGRIAPGIDVRGTGGYVIAPPSPGYRIVSDAPIAHWPDWLLTLALPPPPKPQTHRKAADRTPAPAEKLETITRRALDRVRAAGEGQKHFLLRNMALLLGGIADQAGFSDADAVRWLLDALPGTVRDWRAAETTAFWGLANGRQRPLQFAEELAPATPDPRRKEMARSAFRLLRSGLPSADLLARLHAMNRARPDPLPIHVVDATLLWCATQMRGRAHAA